ncbi:MAG: WbuC family cupin fold metalloprotein [gamma proteobacterium symbiont of Taylorina sp.]|nr:WbuC family cupin fold metalloprotein [gamma proteobacterium symbiont of Taylorina sp.]
MNLVDEKYLMNSMEISPNSNKIIQESLEVYYYNSDLIKITNNDFNWLKQQADKSKENKARICTHLDINASVHEMLIAHKKGNYIPPHRHPNKAESLSVIEGRAIFFIFSLEGEIKQAIPVNTKEGTRYLRINKDFYHTLLIESDYFVYHEVAQGPFNEFSLQIADWSPSLNDPKGINKLLNNLHNISQQLSYS